MRIAGAAVALASLTSGCGAATWLVKKPVTEQCQSAGLQRCDDLAEGVVLYADGKRPEAELKIRTAAQANEPEKVRVFAKALRTLATSLPSEQQAAIVATLDLLEAPPADEVARSGAPRAEPKAAMAAAAAGPGKASATEETSKRTIYGLLEGEIERTRVHVRTGMATPATDARALACETGPLATDPARCRKVLAISGPAIVTNLYAAGGCPDELFALAGPAAKPHWFIGALPAAQLNVSGKLALDEGEELFVGVRAVKDAPKTDPRCTIVWSAETDADAPRQDDTADNRR